MKKLARSAAVLALTFWWGCPTGQAADFDFFGMLNYHNEVKQFNFTTAADGKVTLFSSSWDDGGFDPMLGLWDSAGKKIFFQDDGHKTGATASNGVPYTHGRWDAFYTVQVLPGQYTVTLSTYNNFNKGNKLADGFNFDGKTPIPIAVWNEPPPANGVRTGQYAFHILNVTNAVVTPEPVAMSLFGLGGVFLAWGRRRRGEE